MFKSIVIIIFVLVVTTTAWSFTPGRPNHWTKNSDGTTISPQKDRAVVSTLTAITPQSLTVTTEANIALSSSLLLLTGDNDSDNDAIDLQDGTISGQTLIIVGIALIDADDTITVAMTDTTCTGCITVLLDEIGDTWGLVWTGVTWATISNGEVP
jgi:uncharacterized membrane protein